MIETIHFNLNGRPVKIEVESNRMLLWVLRTNFQLTGTKYGCGEGFCGACTVIVNNQAVRSCSTAVKEIKNKKVLTIEGLEKNGKLHPIQKAFMENDGLQCGYCTPGFVMSAAKLLEERENPTQDEIRLGISGNLCRCTGYYKIIEAIENASKNYRPNKKG